MEQARDYPGEYAEMSANLRQQMVREDVPLNVRIDRVRRAVDLLEGHMTGHDTAGARVSPEPSVSRPRESMELMITSMGDELAGLEERILALAEILHMQVARL